MERGAVGAGRNVRTAPVSETASKSELSYTMEDIPIVDLSDCSFEEFENLCIFLSEHNIGRGMDLSYLNLIRPEDSLERGKYAMRLYKLSGQLYRIGDMCKQREVNEIMYSVEGYTVWKNKGLSADKLNDAVTIYGEGGMPFCYDLGFNRLNDGYIMVRYADSSTAEEPVLEVEVWNDESSKTTKFIVPYKDIDPDCATLVEISAYWAYNEAVNRDFKPREGWHAEDDSTYNFMFDWGIKMSNNVEDAVNQKINWTQLTKNALDEYHGMTEEERQRWIDSWVVFDELALKHLEQMLESMQKRTEDMLMNVVEDGESA